jgi:aminoglycoside phosphotransferase (APT) family kinase protein
MPFSVCWWITLMNAEFNNPVEVRAGEELPVERLAQYLHEKLQTSAGPLVISQFPDGYSNLTYLLQPGSRELVLRRPPFGNKVASAHDMGREFRMLSRLTEVFPAAPKPILFCDDESIIGAPFYLMERRHGLILRKTPPRDVTIDADLARRMSCSLIDNLAALHAIDYQAAGLSDMGKPDGYVQRQVTGWIRRYDQAQTSVVPIMDQVAGWLTEHIPPQAGASVIHNDYKYDNVMFDNTDLTRIVAVLDWEMATIGDPLMDLGSSLGYWVQSTDPAALQHAAFGPTAVPGSLTRQELVARYEQKTGIAVTAPDFYYSFGLFKLAVIVQQIFARFVRGHTTDPRFAMLDHLVLVLSEQADRVIQRGTV